MGMIHLPDSNQSRLSNYYTDLGGCFESTWGILGQEVTKKMGITSNKDKELRALWALEPKL